MDPGCYDRGEFSRLERFIDEEKLRPVRILLTHGHFDHIFGLAYARERWDVPVMMHSEDLFQVQTAGMFADALELDFTPYTGGFDTIDEGDTVRFGDSSLSVLHTPGHTDGCVCFYNAEEKLLFSGDTLFQGSVGRTDHPKGNFQTLLKSVDRLALYHIGLRTVPPFPFSDCFIVLSHAFYEIYHGTVTGFPYLIAVSRFDVYQSISVVSSLIRYYTFTQ